MELSFSELKRKDVINTADGKRLGRVSDIVFSYPENKILGFVVPCGGIFKKEEYFIHLKCVACIGFDVILVNVGVSGKPQSPRDKQETRRSYEEYE